MTCWSDTVMQNKLNCLVMYWCMTVLCVSECINVYLWCSYNRRYAEVCGSEPQAGGGCESVQHCSWDTGSARAAGRTDQHAARRQASGWFWSSSNRSREELGPRAAPGPAGADAHTLEGREIAPLSSRFWKQLQLELAMRREHTTHTHTNPATGYHTTTTPDSTHTQHTSGRRETHRSLFYECLIDKTSIRALAHFICIALFTICIISKQLYRKKIDVI